MNNYNYNNIYVHFTRCWWTNELKVKTDSILMGFHGDQKAACPGVNEDVIFVTS